ncbi:MAG: alpha/beta hydrolase [Chitinophagaceae bacterium]|nr:alpha/beta hydrolase [Chitinophagaceae bacterium]
MKKGLFFLVFVLLSVFAEAQFTVRLVVTDVATRKQDDIYVAGNFNNWNPKDEKYKLKVFGGSRKSVVISDLSAGTYAFKFTRGGFEKVETTNDGRDISDRIIEVNGDISLDLTIAGWKDDYPDKPKRYTASPQVKILDTAFSISQLNRKRRIWLYLPKNYAVSGKTYPVIYLNDGQNLFNEQTSAYGEWGVDECLDSLQMQIGKEAIIVGIDHGGDKRMNEYNPYDHIQFGKGEGMLYADFLATTLKPFIDSRYRTLKGPEYTFVGGSSMGGDISLYTVLQYPNIFGGAFVFSPALWVTPALYELAEKFTSTTMPKFYFYAGGKESATMVSDMKKMTDILEKKSRIQIRKVVSPLGQHNEASWRSEFPDAYKWMTKDY